MKIPNYAHFLSNGITMVLTFRLVKSTTPEVVGNNHICHRVKNKLNVLCISGTGHVTVDLLRR